MDDIHYGVIEQDGAWVIIGAGLHYGAYADRETAERAARRLAEKSVPEVHLHLQDETGQLLPAEKLDS